MMYEVDDRHEACECCTEPVSVYGPPCPACQQPTGMHCSWSDCELEYPDVTPTER